MQAVIFLIILLGLAYAAGYLTREYISRQRHARARRWRDYVEPEWLEPAHKPANTNEAVRPARADAPDEAAALADVAKVELGQLGHMLDRWESRARARRSAS